MDLFIIIMVCILIYLIPGMIIGSGFKYDDDIQTAVIFLWPVFIVGTVLFVIFMLIRSTYRGCVKLINQLIEEGID